MTGVRSRTGATMVMVAILITVLLGMAAMAIDVSRLFVMREQLQTASDAAALAGAVELLHQRSDAVAGTAVDYARLNRVEAQQPDVSPVDVELGIWDFGAGLFTPVPKANWTEAGVNAVRVTSRYATSYTFARVFDEAGSTLQTRAVAAVGYVAEASCVKPWAMSYQDLLDALFGEGARSALSYDLQPEDVASLARVDILNGNTAPFAPGNIGEVRFGGGGSYADDISGCSRATVSPGETIEAEPGMGSGQTVHALRDFCDAHGGSYPPGNGNSDFTCIGAPKVKVVLWDTMDAGGSGKGGANARYHVKYVGVVAITGYSKKAPYITGYFTALASDGAFGTVASPLMKVALVK